MNNRSSACNHVDGQHKDQRTRLGRLVGGTSSRWCLGLLLLATAAGLTGCIAYPVAPAPGPTYYEPYYRPAYVYPHYYYGRPYYHPYYGCRGRCG
jgi:hypothetical protein